MGIEIIILLIEVEFLPYGIVSGYIIYKGTRYIRTMNNNIDLYYYELVKKMKDIALSYNCFNDIFFHSFLQQTEDVVKRNKNKPFYRLYSFIKAKLNHNEVDVLYSSNGFI